MPRHSKKPLTTVRLHTASGQVFEFDSLNDLVSFLPGNWRGWEMARSFGATFKHPIRWGLFFYAHPRYVATDLWSEPISPDTVYQAWCARYRKPSKRRLGRLTAERGRDYVHRRDPVPGTGGFRGGGGMFRPVRTANEKRAWDAATDDDGNPVRKNRRKPAELPSEWDDICRSDVDDRCWKRYRRTQHKRASR